MLLLKYINDPEVSVIFNNLKKYFEVLPKPKDETKEPKKKGHEKWTES